MSIYQKRARQRATLLGAFVGIIIIFTFVFSLVSPGLESSNTTNNQSVLDLTPGTPQPTAIIIPTAEPDPQLTGELPHIHTSGYFQTFRPAGTDWVISDNPFEEEASNRLSVVTQSGRRLVVLHNYIQPGVEFETLESFSSTYLTAAYFAGSWSDYDEWEETGREVRSDSVVIDFKLVVDGNDFLGRDISRVIDRWLYVTRIVVPANNAPLLDLLETLAVPAFVPYPDLFGLPQSWPAYIDQETGFILKPPFTWQRVAGDVGRPVTFSGPPDQPAATIRVWTEPDRLLASTSDAEAWLLAAEPTATIHASAAVSRQVGTGFQVAYAYRDSAGDEHSGLVVLLNDAAGTLFVANLQLETPGINFMDVETLSAEDNVTQQIITRGFIVLPDGARRAAVPAEAGAVTATPAP